MHIDGECQCGAIRFEAEVDEQKVSICHCTDCQQFSGSAWRASVPAPAVTFRFTQGKPTTYIKTGESGNRRLMAFCGNCGSSLYSAAPENTPFYNLRVGAINQRADLPAKRQIWMQSALPWALDIHGLPGVEKG
jgi:hypothetical protein